MAFGMLSTLPAAFGIFAATYVLLLAFLHASQDANEPPSASDTIPFLSPVLNMVFKGAGFHRYMRDKYNLPIYTLRLPGSRIYVVNSLQLISSIQSQPQALSFAAVVAGIANNVIGLTKDAKEIVNRNVTGNDGYLMSVPQYLHAAVRIGPSLHAMNRRSVQVISQSLDRWAGEGETTVKMFRWIRHELLMATTEGVYGPNNPFRDPEMEKAWYTFESKVMIFFMNIWPRLFARESFKAREQMVKAWERYFETASHEQGSELMKRRAKVNADFQIPEALKITARMEVGGTQAILGNTLPGTFWVIYHIFSDQTILEDIRSELLQGVQEDDCGNCTIDLSHVTSSCPILMSTFKEAMRFHSTSMAVRIATEDHLLDNRYLLKKGSIILMPATVQHTERSIWGDTVGAFNHKRFLRDASTKRVNPAAFRGFGGGSTLCPGRHFATTEILMFSALLALRFDLYPVSGEWTAPQTAKSPAQNAMPIPDWDLNVKLCRRNTKAWTVSFSGCDGGTDITAEDIEGTDRHQGH